MREYECLYILDPKLTEEDVTAVSERIGQIVTENGGELLSVNPWGKRRLAYVLKHVREGYYIQMRLNGDASTTGELDQALRFSEAVMRHLIVRADELDPAAADQIPEQLPEPSTDDFDYRRGRRDDRRGPAPEAPAEGEQAAEGEQTPEVEETAAGAQDEPKAAEGGEAEGPAPEPVAEETAPAEQPEEAAPADEPAEASADEPED